MITVAGEALIDMIADADGRLVPKSGGGPFNVARAVARLGQPATFLGRVSGDRFGRLLRSDLDALGVQFAIGAATDVPTTLAVTAGWSSSQSLMVLVVLALLAVVLVPGLVVRRRLRRHER